MNYKKFAVSLCTALFFSILFPTVSMSDQFHYKNLLIGERPAGMAGAYNAVSDSPEGAFYNPAGMAYAVGKSLSVSVNAYHNTWTTYEGVLGGGDWDRASSSLVPNFFGMIQPFGKGKIAFSYAVPDIIEEDQNQVFTKTDNLDIEKLVINLSNLDKTYKLGPSYAVKINDSLAMGLTLYLHYRQQKQIWNQYITFKNSSTTEWTNQNYRFTEYGIDPKFGVMWSPRDKFSLGLTVSKNLIFSSDAKEQKIRNSQVQPEFSSDDVKSNYPLSVSLGGAWFKSESLLLTCDLDYYGEVLSDNREAVLNFAVGTEYYLTEKYALRGGFYTNMANTSEVPDITDVSHNDHIDLYGVTASFTRFTRSSAMTLGMNYSYGVGGSQPVGLEDTDGDGTRDAYRRYDASVSALTVFLSGSFNY